MRVLVLFAHPVEDSFNAAVHAIAVESLKAAGHEVDDCDLYAEGFSPVLTREERIGYHDLATNRAPVAAYVERLLAAEALVIVSPIWNFGWPAILKGFFDRVFLPGVSFRIDEGKYVTTLKNIGKVAAVVTYGATPLRAFLAGDPPRRIVKRVLRVLVKPGASVDYIARYDMNNATQAVRQAFLERVQAKMRAF
jgi:putative NADPH-quinone reductase